MYDYPQFYDENANYPQFPELTEEKQKKRQYKARATDSAERYRELSAKARVGDRTTNTHEFNVERVLAGAELSADDDINTQLRREQAQYSALTDAIHLTDKTIRVETQKASKKVCADLQPEHDRLIKALCKQLADVHATHHELWSMKRNLINNWIGLNGLCANMPEFLGVPTDRSGPMASFFRQVVADKLISASSMPREFR